MAEYFVLRQLSQNPRHAEQPENSGANTYSRMLMWVHNEHVFNFLHYFVSRVMIPKVHL
jgi:hypothetical protein